MDPLLARILIPFRLLAIYQPPELLGFKLLNPVVPVVLILAVDLYIASNYPQVFFDHGTNIRLLMDLVQGYGPIFAYLVILLEAFKSRKTIQGIWQNLKIILDIFEKDLKSSLKLEFRRMLMWYIVYAIILKFLCLLVEVLIIVGVQRNTMWFYNRLANFPGFFGSRTFILSFTLHVRIFRFLLLSIVKYQRSINFKLIHCKKKRDMMKKQEKLQHHLRRAYNKLILLNWQINEAFKFSLLATFVSNVICIAIAWIWNYLSLRFGNAFMFGGWMLG